MVKPDQELFETLAAKLKLPIAILGAGGMMLTLVAALLAMLHFAPGPAGTAEGPDMYNHRADVPAAAPVPSTAPSHDGRGH